MRNLADYAEGREPIGRCDFTSSELRAEMLIEVELHPGGRWAMGGFEANPDAGRFCPRRESRGYPRAVFSPHGPSLRELCVQALSSVERGYDLLAPKFDYTPFRTSETVLDATADVLSGRGPFGGGVDVCCGTGAGLKVLQSLCRGPVTGVDFSAGMLAQARRAYPDAKLVRADVRALPFRSEFDLAVSFGALGHFLPAERPALFGEVFRSLRPGGLFALPLGTPPPATEVAYWTLLGFDAVMRVRNAVWRPPFVMYYRTSQVDAVTHDLTAAGFVVEVVDLTALGRYRDGSARCVLLLGSKQ